MLVDGKEVDTLAGHVDLRRPLAKKPSMGQRHRHAHAIETRRRRAPPHHTHAAITSRTPKARCSSKPGRTRVICTASVEDRVPPFLRNTGKGWVTAEYGMLPRATSTRTQREATAGKVGGRTQEIQRLIGRSLRSVDEPPGARRAHDLDRLRRHPGRRRHAHRVDHRRVRRAGAGAREAARAGRDPRRFRSSTTSPPSASASSTASRCSISRTKTTRAPTST